MFQALHSQAYMNDKEVESTLSKWTQLVSLSCYISCGIHLFSGIGRCHILEALFAYIIQQIQFGSFKLGNVPHYWCFDYLVKDLMDSSTGQRWYAASSTIPIQVLGIHFCTYIVV